MAASKEIKFEKSAVKFISKQQPEQRKRLIKAIKGLPDEGDIKKMHGYKSLYRLRVGDFRVLYRTQTNGEIVIVIVEDIDNRGQVYK